MGAPETGWYRTESGVVIEMDHPLPEAIAQRVNRGEIVRVANDKGEAYIEPKPKRGKAALSDERNLADELKAVQAHAGELEKQLAEVTAERDGLKATAEQNAAAQRVPPARAQR